LLINSFLIDTLIGKVEMKKYTYDNNRKANRRGKEYKEWRSKVINKYKRCDICNIEEDLTAHHLESWVFFPKKRFLISNGVCLCKACHTIFHCDYKDSFRQKATKKDYEEFRKIAKFYMR
jgi:hypothetical protein